MNRMDRYRLDVRRARKHWWRFRPKGWIGPPDPVLLEAMMRDLGEEIENMTEEEKATWWQPRGKD